MKNLRRMCAVAILTMTLVGSAFAGQIHSPGYVPPATATERDIKLNNYDGNPDDH